MSIKEAAVRAYAHPQQPDPVAAANFAAALGRELEHLGFKQAKSDESHPFSHQFCYAPSDMHDDSVKSLIIVGPVPSIRIFPGEPCVRVAPALKIDFHDTAKGVCISVTPQHTSDLGKFSDIPFGRPYLTAGEPTLLKWSERNVVETLLARWIMEHAAPKIAQHLKAPAP